MTGRRSSYPLSFINQYVPMPNQNKEASIIQDIIELEEPERRTRYLTSKTYNQEALYSPHISKMDEEKRPYPVRMDSIQSSFSTRSETPDGLRSHPTKRPFDTPEEDLEKTSEASHHHHYHDGIFWRSPILMGGNLLIGIIASISHHVFYSQMVGKEVGDEYSQQWTLR